MNSDNEEDLILNFKAFIDLIFGVIVLMNVFDLLNPSKSTDNFNANSNNQQPNNHQPNNPQHSNLQPNDRQPVDSQPYNRIKDTITRKL